MNAYSKIDWTRHVLPLLISSAFLIPFCHSWLTEPKGREQHNVHSSQSEKNQREMLIRNPTLSCSHSIIPRLRLPTSTFTASIFLLKKNNKAEDIDSYFSSSPNDLYRKYCYTITQQSTQLLYIVHCTS